MITQKELKEFQEARALRAQAQQDEKKLRTRILKRHKTGARVERGNLDLEVVSKISMQYRADQLRAALGRDGFRELKTKVLPTCFEVLLIRRSSNETSSVKEMEGDLDCDCWQ